MVIVFIRHTLNEYLRFLALLLLLPWYAYEHSTKNCFMHVVPEHLDYHVSEASATSAYLKL